MRKSTLALAFAVILAVLAVVAVRKYLVESKRELEKGTNMVEILVTNEPIAEGEKVRPSQVRGHKVPSSSILPEMVTTTDKDLVIGKRSRTDLGRDKLILLPYFQEAPPTAMVPITPGMRLATVAVNSVSGVAGLLSPGDYVDVLWTSKGSVQASGAVSESTQTLFNQVQIHAVDDISVVGYRPANRGRGQGPVTPYTTVTLVLYPLECELLVYARASGEITLTKRNATDGGAPPSPGVDGSHVDDLADQAKNLRKTGGGK